MSFFSTTKTNFLSNILYAFDSSDYKLSKYTPKFNSLANTASTLHLISCAEISINGDYTVVFENVFM